VTGGAAAGEYKPVTVLCGVLADGPTLAVRLGPERWYRLLQSWLALVQAVVQEYEGTLLPGTGEGMTALFGAPAAQEDHARRAVLAALALRERVQTHPALTVHGSAVTVRMGLHSGLVVAGDVGAAPHPRYTAVGEAPHVALQLQQHAAPGTICLSAATYALVQAEVRVEACRALAAESPGEPRRVYTVHGLAQRLAGVSGQGMRHRSRFVGRERELALLHERLAHAAQGHGHVIGIGGEPGMGKSRLLAEFHHSLAGQPVRYREGHCFPYSSTTPYLPVCALLRQGCDITEADGQEVITAKVRRYLEDAQLIPEDGAPLLLQLLDIPVHETLLARYSPQDRKARTFALLRHLMWHDCQEHPLVMVVENLHWADATSEEWLTALVEHLPGAAILLLVTHRPGYHPPWLGHSGATQIALPQLLPEDSRALIRSVLHTTSLPEPLVQGIVTQAAGNPFFLEELTWAAMEHPTAPAVPGIPDTIHAVLAARIDRLPPEEKRLLQTAAVIGHAVPVPLLRAIAEVPEEAVHRGLAHLQAAEFLYETRLFPKIEYTFKHALTQEVAYGNLLVERRRVLHALIVQALEALAGDRLAGEVERLAHHALRGEVWDKVLAYCRKAGEKALARSAHREAVGYYEQALGALQHLPEQPDTREQAIDLRLALHSALRPFGDFGRIQASLREAEVLAEALNDQRRLGQVLLLLSSHFRIMAAYNQSVDAAQGALALATASGEVVLQALANQYLGFTYHAQGDYRRAIDCLGRAVANPEGAQRGERFGQLNLPAVLSRAFLVVCYAELGMFAEATILGEEGLRIAEAAAHPASLMFASWGIGLLSLRQGDLPRALARLERAAGICQDANLPFWFPRMAATLGAAYALAGRVADAVSLLTQGMEQAVAMGTGVFQALCHLSLGEAHMLAGRLEEAQTLAEHALALTRERQERGQQASTLRLLGEIAARREPPESAPAKTYYRQALVLAEECGMRPLQAHCHLSLGTLYIKTGQREQARAALVTAIGLYRALDMTFWLPQAEAALAQAESRARPLPAKAIMEKKGVG
jgi:class 3 adenylate cyclase/tetratricopeptide (TPR) repeat protein